MLDRLLGCGALVVESAGEHGKLTLANIPHVEQVSSSLFQLVEDERLRDGRSRGPRPALPDQGDFGDPSLLN